MYFLPLSFYFFQHPGKVQCVPCGPAHCGPASVTFGLSALPQIINDYPETPIFGVLSSPAPLPHYLFHGSTNWPFKTGLLPSTIFLPYQPPTLDIIFFTKLTFSFPIYLRRVYKTLCDLALSSYPNLLNTTLFFFTMVLTNSSLLKLCFKENLEILVYVRN